MRHQALIGKAHASLGLRRIVPFNFLGDPRVPRRQSERRLALGRARGHAQSDAARSKRVAMCGVGLSPDGILAVHCGEVAEPGLRRTPGERVFSKGNRGFKSPPLRHAKPPDLIQF